MQNSGTETGTVVRTEGTKAVVMTNKSRSCNECGKAQAGICGKSGAGMVLTVENPAGARQGDIVELGLDRDIHWKGYFIVFVLPVAALFLFTYAGHVISRLTGVGGMDAAAGLAGLVLSVVYAYRKMSRLAESTMLHITHIHHAAPEYSVGVRSEETDYLGAFNRNC